MNISKKVKVGIAKTVATLCILILIAGASFMVYTTPAIGVFFGVILLIAALILSLHYIETNKDELWVEEQ